MSPHPKLLVVEDDPALREVLCMELQFSLKCQIIPACGVDHALELLAIHDVELIVSDFLMPDGNGLDLLFRLRAAGLAEPPMVIITGLTHEDADGLERHGVAAVVRKPFAPSELLGVIEEIRRTVEVVAS